MTNRVAERVRRSWPATLRTVLAVALSALLVWGQLPTAAWAAVADAQNDMAVSELSSNATNNAYEAGDSADDSSTSAVSEGSGTDTQDSSGSSHGTSSDGSDAAGDQGSAGSQTASGSQSGASAQGSASTAGTTAAGDTDSAASSSSTTDSSGTSGNASSGVTGAATTGDAAVNSESTDTATLESDASKTSSASSEQDETVTVQVRIIGRDTDGNPEEWASALVDMPAGSAASDAFEQVFADQGITADYGVGEWGWSLDTITDPNDPTRVLGWDATTGRYWQLFENGTAADVGASSIILEEGDSIVLYYSAYGDTLPEEDEQQQISVSMEVYGVTADGETERWVQTTAQVDEGMTAAELTEHLLTLSGYDYYVDTSWGWYLSTITSSDGRVLGWDDVTGAYWQFWYNGAYSMSGAGDVVLAEGDSIAWYYAADGAEYPEDGATDDTGITVDPDATRPDWDDAYEYGQGATEAATPTGDVEAAWTESLKDSSDWATYLSDPLLAHGYLYICVGDEIIMKDAETGEEICRAQLAASIDSVARMVLTDGLIIVPVHGGRLQALTADALTTVWITDELPGYSEAQDQQALGCITVSDGRLYFATAAAGWSTTYNGYLICVDVQTGEVLWQYQNETSGYYWAGAVVSGDYAIIADDAGTVNVFDAVTGDVVSTLDLGTGARAKVVAGTDADTFFVVTRDGVLHKLALDEAAGTLSEVGSVAFGSSSTSTPVICNGKIYVGGASLEGYANSWGSTSYYGVIAVIDESTLVVEYSISATTDGMLPATVQASPLVSQQGSETYVYFTCNAEPGGIYRYRVGDTAAELIYTPEDDNQNYCMASIVCGADGTLYYINDSGTLFAVRAASSGEGGTGGSTGGGTTGGTGGTGSTGGSTGGTTHGGSTGGSTSGGSSGGAAGGSLAGATSSTGSHFVAAGASPISASSALNTIAPAAQPISQRDDEEGTEEESASETDDGADESDAVATAESSVADGAQSSSAASAAQLLDAVQSTNATNAMWPIAGLVVGVCGLIAIAVYLVQRRRHE